MCEVPNQHRTEKGTMLKLSHSGWRLVLCSVTCIACDDDDDDDGVEAISYVRWIYFLMLIARKRGR